MKMRVIDLDNNATTALDPLVREAMLPYMTGSLGNASSRHSLGRRARRAIDDSKQRIAASLGSEPEEIFFTSGATEANNLAILAARMSPSGHILLNPSEHPSALEPTLSLANRGFDLESLALDQSGLVAGFELSLRAETRLVVLQLANGETGCVQDIATLADCVPPGCRFHCDAVQAIGRVRCDFRRLGVASLTLSGHKIHGPGGIGALLVRDGWSMRPMLLGGKQQDGLRSGTEPVAAIVGLAAAVELAIKRLESDAERLSRLRDRFETGILRRVPSITINGPLDARLPNTSNLSFLGTNAGALVVALDVAGVCCSAGPACASGTLQPSAVLRAMGFDGERLLGAIRFSLGRFTSEADIDDAVDRVADAVRQVRATVNPLHRETSSLGD